MASNVIDSLFYKDKYSTKYMREIFSDENLIRKLLDVEAALSRSQAKIGIIPGEAAEIITEKAKYELIDLEELNRQIASTSHPFIPLLKVFTSLCGEAGQYVHWGATTQDIMDTAVILQVKEAYEDLYNHLLDLNKLLMRNSEQYKELIMMGRTNGQHALPITLGFKFAVWTAETQRHIQRMAECKKRLFVGQFSGAVGTLASISEQAFELRQLLFKELDLQEPVITWNTSRDNLVEFASVIGIMASTMGKIGNEVYALQKQELSELEDHIAASTVGSSTMPHKRNPFVAMEVASLSRLLRTVVFEAFETLENEHERDPRSLSLEYDYIGRLCCMASAILDKSIKLVDNMTVNKANIMKNINLLHGVVFSESVMMRLGEHIGRAQAHELVHELAMQALEEGIPFKNVLLSQEVITSKFTEKEIDAFLTPENYLGLATQFIDNVLAENAKLLKSLRTV